MKLVIPKSIPNVHLLQADSKGANPPLSGAYPVFYDGAKSGKKPHSDKKLQARTIPFGDLLSTALQLSHKQIQDLMELLPKMNNVEKKQQIINGGLRIREQMYKLAIMTDFLGARGTDLALAEIGMDTLRGYSEALVKTADGMAFSLAQTLSRMAPKPALPQAIQLIATGQSTNLPSIMDEFCTMSKTNGSSEQWLRRLDNVIKLHVSRLQFGKSRVEGIRDGVVVLFFDGATVKLTLVPIFETSGYAWHILDIDPGELVQSEQSRTALLIQFQARFNRRSTQELLDLPIRLDKDLSRLQLLHRFNRLQEDFARLRESLYPDLEIQLTGPSTFKVVPWKHLGKTSPHLTVSADVKDCVLAVEIDGNDVSGRSAEELIEMLVSSYGVEKLKQLHDRLQEAAPVSIPLFQADQLVLEQVLRIAMPSGEIEIYMQRFSGALIAKDSVELTKLLSTNKIDQIVKYLKAYRTKELLRILSLHDASSLVVVDPSIVSIPQLSSNYLVFALRNFVGKMVAADLGQWPGPLQVYLVSEDASMSGRLVVDPLSGIEVPNLSLEKPEEILYAVSSNVESYCSPVVEQELSMRGISFKQINVSSWILLNIGALPSVKEITLYASISTVEIRIGFGGAVPINPEFTQTTAWYIEPHVIKFSGRTDFNSMFRRLHGFLALMALSKQLELRQVKHEFAVEGHLYFGHAQLGRIRISINDRACNDGLPLEMSFDRQELLHPDQAEALQRQIRQSLSIGPIVEYLNRLSSS